MTGINRKKWDNPQFAYLVPIFTILLSGILCIGLGFAGLASSSETSGDVGSSGMVIELKDNDGALMSQGGFSTGQTVKYTKVGNQYFFLTGNYKLGESALIINATGTTATSIGLTVDISHKLQGNNTYVNGLPYFQTSEFILKNSSGTVVDMSDIPISPGINTFHVEFYGIMNSSQSVGSVSPSFEYQLLFKATPL